MTVSILSPFRWRETPRESIFMADPRFYKGARTGKSMNQLQSESVDRITASTGINPGTIHGISAKADAQAERSAYRRRAAK